MWIWNLKSYILLVSSDIVKFKTKSIYANMHARMDESI